MGVKKGSKARLVARHAEKQRQAVQFGQSIPCCRASHCKGKAELNRNKGACPNIHHAAINRRLEKTPGDTTSHAGNSILTAVERDDLKDAMSSTAAAGHGFRPSDRTQAVLDILEWRDQCTVQPWWGTQVREVEQRREDCPTHWQALCELLEGLLC